MSDPLTVLRPDARAQDPAPLPDRPVRAPRAMTRRSWEHRIFAGATLVGLVHGLDDAFVGRQPGAGADHAVAGLLAVLVAAVAVAGFPRLRPGLRALVALALGVPAVVNGVLHVIHIGLDGPAGSDATGVLAAAAGAVLIGLAAVIPVLHRGERAESRGRRWRNRLVAVVGTLAVTYVVIFPVAIAVTVTHKYREPIGDPPGAAYEDVRFSATDGIRLSGWYRPSRNGAAVVLVHGGGGDRMGVRSHAELLARHGYGVLLYDSRGRGTSQGSPNSLGWGWDKDVGGALDYLAHRADVEAGRIGGLGLSTGADVLIEVAAERRDLRAVVSDGATARSFGDYMAADGSVEGVPYWWTMLAAASVLSGSSPGPPLEELSGQVSPTPLLLISAGLFATEGQFNGVYARAAREPVEHWHLRQGHHTAGIREYAREYERRVVGLFDRALLR